MGQTDKTDTIKEKKTGAVKNATTGASVGVAKTQNKSATTGAPKKKRVNRGDKKRPATKEKFLQTLMHANVLGNVLVACRRLHIDRSTVYDWKDKDPEFAKKWAIVQDEANDRLADEAENALLKGIRNINPTLIIFTLKNRRPEKWRDRFEHTGEGGGPIEYEHEISPEFAAALADLYGSKQHGKTKNKPVRQ